MGSTRMVRTATALAVVALFSGCATWSGMDRSEKGTAVGATGGALVGAAVGGPVGAAIGAGVGGYAGHHQASDTAPSAHAAPVRDGTPSMRDGTPATSRAADAPSEVRNANANVADAYRSSPAVDDRSAATTSPASGPDVGATQAQPRPDASAGTMTGGAQDGMRRADDVARSDAARTTDGMSGSGFADAHDPQTIRSLQASLRERGFDPGPIDGIWGPRTESALRRFQESQGLSGMGQLDAQTMSALELDAARSFAPAGAPAHDAASMATPGAAGSLPR